MTWICRRFALLNEEIRLIVALIQNRRLFSADWQFLRLNYLTGWYTIVVVLYDIHAGSWKQIIGWAFLGWSLLRVDDPLKGASIELEPFIRLYFLLLRIAVKRACFLELALLNRVFSLGLWRFQYWREGTGEICLFLNILYWILDWNYGRNLNILFLLGKDFRDIIFNRKVKEKRFLLWRVFLFIYFSLINNCILHLQLLILMVIFVGLLRFCFYFKVFLLVMLVMIGRLFRGWKLDRAEVERKLTLGWRLIVSGGFVFCFDEALYGRDS